MAGKIVADQIEHSTAGSLDTQYVVNGSAKAWANFDGTGTVATRATFNQTSLTDITTGRYDLSFVSNMSNANYSVATGGAYSATVAGSAGYGAAAVNQLTTSQYQIQTGPYSTGPQPADIAVVMPCVSGDLA
jgi:hypothetical protein